MHHDQRTARKYCQIHPGKIGCDIVTYTVLPIDDDAPPVEALREAFNNDSFEIFALVREALCSDPPEYDPSPNFSGGRSVGEEFPRECPGCGGDIHRRVDRRQEPAHFEPEVRKRKKARMASPA